MKYSILGFNQSKVMETELDLTDLLLLNYILQACGTPKMKHILDSNDCPMVWLQHKKLSEDLPILRISEGTLRNRLVKLRQSGYINSKIVAGENVRGSRTYYSVTEMTMSLIYDVNEQTTSLKNDVIAQSRHSKMTSNNLLKDNTILKDTIISKDIIVENSPETSSSDISEYESHMYQEENKKKSRKVCQEEKKPKKNLWQKCADAIEEYTQDENLKKVLYDYLNMRLQMRDRPIYANQWKVMLNKLSTIQDDPIKVVQQSIERAYCGFFPLLKYSQYNRNSKPDPSTFGEYEEMSCEKVSETQREELNRNGRVF